MPSPSRALLTIEQAGHPVSRIRLGDGPIRIGSDRGCDVRITAGDPPPVLAEVRAESGGHAVVAVGGGPWYGGLLRRRPRVTVNGEAVESRQLSDGDVVEFGTKAGLRLVYRLEVARAESDRAVSPAAADPMANGRSAALAAPGQTGMASLARFFEFSRKLGGGFSLEEVLLDVVDLAIEVTRAERGMLILRRDDGTLDMQVARASEGRSLLLDGLRVSETLVQKAFAEARPSVIADVGQDAALAMTESIVSLELRSAVTLPLVRVEAASEVGGPTVFGLIYLDSRRRRGGFDGFDLGILGRLANDASAVIENARLLREAEERRRIAHEVRMAREVHAALMPEQFRSPPGFAVVGTCVPCHDLGGDYVDQFELADGRMALVVADVCGKGIAASLLAATLQGALAAEIAEPRPLGEVVARVNRVHCRLAPVGKFVTLAVAVLGTDGSATIVNAGHCPVLHVHGGGASAIPTTDMALGFDADAGFHAVTVQLQPGESLVLYTDGVVECEGPGQTWFGDQRLTDVLAAHRSATAAELLAAVLREVDAFRRDVPTSDDLSLVIVRRDGSG